MEQFLNKLVIVANNINTNYTKLQELPLNQWIGVKKFQFTTTRHGRKLTAFTKTHGIIFLPARIADFVEDDEQLKIMNKHINAISFQGMDGKSVLVNLRRSEENTRSI